MTDANLCRVLQPQTSRKVGLLRYDVVAAGAEAVRARIALLVGDNVQIAIADALSERDLLTLAQGTASLRLLTGASGLAAGLPDLFRGAGRLRAQDAATLPQVSGHAVVLAGSASEATNRQVAVWMAARRPAFRVDPFRLAAGEPVVQQALAYAAQQDGPSLIYATSVPDQVRAVQHELGAARAGAVIERALADIALGLHRQGVRRFVVAGGETSGAVVGALGVTALRIGPAIDPGVPLTVSLGKDPVALALKSGNFGGPDFFARALDAMEGMPA
jgi:uncharacterized protein YgbK (DUF1537 family)